MTHGSSVSARPTTSQRLNRYLEWSATHRCLQSTRNAHARGLERLGSTIKSSSRDPAPGPTAAVPSHLQQHPPLPRRRPHPSAAPAAAVASGAFRCRAGGPASQHQVDPRGLQENAQTSQPPKTATMSMANSMSGSGGAIERRGACRAGLPPERGGGPSRVPSHPRYNSPPLPHITTACRAARSSVPPADAALGATRPSCPGTRGSGGTAGRLPPVLPLPDADEPQLPFNDPTQYRYELIRPLVLFQDRTAKQRGPGNGTHPDTVGTLKRRLAQGMLRAP